MCLPVRPYKVEREWKAFGLSCAVVQNREAGNRCGYVRVPPGHPAWGKHYDDVDVDVHGGLTFARPEPCMEHEDGQGYWLGFDYAHCYDAMYDPNMTPEDCETEEGRKCLEIHRRFHPGHVIGSGLGEHWWTEEEVVAETEHLAEQLAALGTKG